MTDTNLNIVGSNDKQIEIRRLRSVSLDDRESAVARIQAARKLLQDYGPTQRNLPIVRKVVSLFVSDSDANVAERALKLRARLVQILELKKVKIPKDIEDQPIEISEDSIDSDAIGFEPEVRKLSDVWTLPAPPDTDEVLRIAYIVRNYVVLDHGIDVWQDGVNVDDVLDLVLDGREKNIKNLQKLHRFMELPFASGVRCLVTNALYDTVTKILKDRGALPLQPSNMNALNILDEIEGRI